MRSDAVAVGLQPPADGVVAVAARFCNVHVFARLRRYVHVCGQGCARIRIVRERGGGEENDGGGVSRAVAMAFESEK